MPQNPTEWLTPSLIGAAVVMVGWLITIISAMRKELSSALLQLVRHETILQQQGLFEPQGGPMNNID